MIHHSKKKLISFEELPYSAVLDDNSVFIEYRRLKRLLGRNPTKLELLITDLIWSERCCQKSTKAHLSKLSIKPDANLIKTHEPWALVIKMASNLNQSDCSTDILSMALLDLIAQGARPKAILQSALLGENINKEQMISLADHARELAIPSFCGPIKIDPNIEELRGLAFLVLGIANAENLLSQKIIDTKNRLYYLGRPQKKLKAEQIKALESLIFKAIEAKMLNGLKNIAKGGLALASMSLACQGVGLSIHIDEINLDEEANNQHIFLSEMSGSMLAVIDQKMSADFAALCKTHDIKSIDVGGLNGDGILRVFEHGVELAHLPANMLMENAPRMRLGYQSIIPLAKTTQKSPLSLSLEAVLTQLSRSEQARLSLTNTFDHHVGLNTLLGQSEADCALLQASPIKEQLALTVFAENRLILHSPKEATKRALFESMFRLKAMGSKLSFLGCAFFAGTPEREEVMTHIKHSIDALVELQELCGVSIDSALVELSDDEKISFMLPRLHITALGQKPASSWFSRYGNACHGDLLMLIGEIPDNFTMAEEIFAKASFNILRPWEFEHLLPLQKLLEQITFNGLCSSISIVGQGGLWAGLMRIINKSGWGLNLEFGEEWLGSEILLNLFSEDSLRILLTIKEHQLMELKKQCANLVCLQKLGRVEGENLLIRHNGQIYYQKDRKDVLAGRYLEKTMGDEWRQGQKQEGDSHQYGSEV